MISLQKNKDSLEKEKQEAYATHSSSFMESSSFTSFMESSSFTESGWAVLSLFFWIKSMMSSFVLPPSYCNKLPLADLKYKVG